MSAFITTRDRDAWATIRGYVYQVELTIERWFDLRADQVLELECGEDIDTVQKALFSEEEEQSRLLEQIRRRAKSLTIRSPQAIEALASFYEHLVANPKLDLSFRYVTNARIGTEKPSRMPKRIPAILAWNQILGNELSADDQIAAVSGIRRSLNNASKPEGLNDRTWTSFADFIAKATDDDLVNFIRRVEWKTQVNTTESLRAGIQRALTNKRDASPNAVDAIYERLFLYVFRLLSRPERKQLTVDDLGAQLRLPTLSPADQQLSDNLRILLCEIETRVAALEEGFKQQQQTNQQMDSQLHALEEQVGLTVAVDYAFRLPQLDLPPLAEPVVRRQAVVSRYIEQFELIAWCALYAEIGRGKTSLSRLIADAYKHRVWIRLDGLNGNNACIRIDESLSAISGTKPSPYREMWYDNICAELAPGTLIVLDDLPQMTGNDLLGGRCITLARICARHNIKLLSSSAYNLPPQVRQALGDDLLLSEEAPHFTDQEIRALFEAHGAPEHFVSGRGVEWLASLTERNPTLLVAAARYLVQHNWDLLTDAFDGIARGVYAQQTNDQTQLLLMETVSDVRDRELLYRLNLIQGVFSDKELSCVSEVSPAITLPVERLTCAIGLWVQRDSEDTYAISPLLKQLGSANLERAVTRNVHLALGDAVLEKHLLGPLDVFDAVHHFHSGEAFNRAGTVLLKALGAIQYDDNVKADWGISGLWYNVPLPEQMDLNIRLMLRARQIAVCHKLGKNVDCLVADLDCLLEQATDENAAWVVGTAVMVGPSWARENPVLANRYLLKAVSALPKAVLKDGRPLRFSEGVTLESLIWVNGYQLKSAEELRDWLSTAEELSLSERRAALEGSIVKGNIVPPSCLSIAASLWLVELAKPESERDWDSVLQALEELSDRARNLGFELLWACSVSFRIRILGQYKDDIGVAEALARETMASASNDPTVRFVIQEAIGLQLGLANRLDEALPWLTGALDEKTEAYAFERVTALLRASQAVGKADGPLALRHTTRAVQLGETSPEVPETQLIRALGEHAVALWSSGDLSAAYGPMQDAVQRLLANKNKDDEWKMLMVRLGHALFYISTLAKYGSPPQTGSDGYPYQAPVRGAFLIENSSAAVAFYSPAHNSYLPGSLVNFAEGIGNDEEAAKWAIIAFDIARESGDSDQTSTLGQLALGYLILKDRFAEALDVARDVGATAVAVEAIGSSSKEHVLPGFDADSVLGERGNARWQKAEYYAALLGLVPSMFRIATIGLDNSAQAAGSATLAARACREVLQDALTPDLWNSAAELFEEVSTVGVNPEELLAKGNDFDVDLQLVWRALCYIRASLDCGPQRALQIHLAILPFLCEHFRPFLSIYRQTLVPFVEAFWLKAFRENRLSFSNPTEVEYQLERALTTRDDTIVQRLLQIVTTAVGMRVDEPTRLWLNQL